jgi:hypothetical protein
LKRAPAFTLLALLPVLALAGCKKKVTKADCDTMIDRYATLVVNAHMPDASAETIRTEQERERAAAHGDDAFKSCTAEVTVEEHACAMAAKTPDAFEKCLE